MFTGLSAFPLTPFADDDVDESAFVHLVERLVTAEVDSITALGSTGSYAYLDRSERRRVARLAVRTAGRTPVLVGIGATRTRHVLELADDAQAAGAAGLLLAPVSYQQPTADDVYRLFETVDDHVSVPLVLYDNPGTTHFSFTDDLYRSIAALTNLASIKIPGVPGGHVASAARVQQLRSILPADVAIGVSGDQHAAAGLSAGCDLWYSVLGGTLPQLARSLVEAAEEGADAGRAASTRLQPLWDLFAEHGSLRVTAAIAEHLGLARSSCLPLPLQGLAADARARVTSVVELLELRD
nr:Dihydrodipicolinate synthase family protein [Aeromicrobium sp.]